MNGMKNKLIALDTNIFIYHFESNPRFIPYTNRIFMSLIRNKNRATTSVISLIETLSYPTPKDILETIEEGFRTVPNLKMVEINHQIGIESARIRRAYGIRLPNAIQLATAICEKADVFFTNDIKLQKFKEIKVTLLTDINEESFKLQA